MAKYVVLFLVFILCVVSTPQSRSLRSCHSRVHNVIDYGAVGDGKTDDSKAFMDAWKATCESSTCSSTMHIPHEKTFMLQPLSFGGNCKANRITFQVDGKLKAPSKPDAWHCHKNHKCKQWINFDEVDGLFIQGSGTIDGQGSKWWEHHFCKNHKKLCGRKPTGLTVTHSENVHISQLTFKDSPQMHIALERSNRVYVTNLTIQAPGDSPNTDGIHIQHSQHVHIYQSSIGTGDDCVSIGDGSSYINITNVACGPGHGISIGSLGIDGKEETVEHVHVKNVSFTGTQNGVRIKTWQGGKGYARNIVFEKIKSEDSTNPIIIDQFYCDHRHCKNHTSAVHISNVTYDTIWGTSHKKYAVQLTCSKTVPCTNILLKDVNLQREEDEDDETSSHCMNVQGHTQGNVFPKVPCLS